MLKKFLAVGIILLFISSGIIPFASSNEVSSNNIIYVDDDGGADYTRIQDAIDNASEGDTIIVMNGTYQQNIIVDKPLTIRSECGYTNCTIKAVDLDDAGCLDSVDTDESNCGDGVCEASADETWQNCIADCSAPQCADSIDNDWDNLIDYPADPGCTDANDNDETDVIGPVDVLSDGFEDGNLVEWNLYGACKYRYSL